MKRFLILCVFPLVGLALIALGVIVSWTQLCLRLDGGKTAGRVAGMAIVRRDACDLVTGLDTTLALTLANGEQVRVAYRDYAPVAAQYGARGSTTPHALPLAALAPGTNAGGQLTRELRTVLADAARGDATTIRWALQREGRHADEPTRVVRLEKTETARGYFGMATLSATLVCDADGIRPAGAPASVPPRGTVTTRAVFDATDPAALLRNKGESMTAYLQLRGSVTNTPEKKDFLLYCEPYATEFRPVFTYAVSDRHHALLSHIGRHSGPTLAIILYGPCWVYYDLQQPARAVLIADPGPPAGAWLAWFSRVCEGTFTQWGSAALIILAGIIFILIGLIQISMAVWPSTRLWL